MGGHDQLEAFSDGVFAIAITLPVLEIKIPSHELVKALAMWRHASRTDGLLSTDVAVRTEIEKVAKQFAPAPCFISWRLLYRLRQKVQASAFAWHWPYFSRYVTCLHEDKVRPSCMGSVRLRAPGNGRTQSVDTRAE